MTVPFWIAKYIDDPFRNEPRNIGVVVATANGIASRFVGEREDGTFDLRRVKGRFAYPQVYSQWREYWLGEIRKSGPSSLEKSQSANFYVHAAGEVGDTGGDSAADVCEYLFRLLVGDNPLSAYGWDDAEADEVVLADDIRNAFIDAEILSGEAQLLVRHPVVPGIPVQGAAAAHTPSFTQRNGVLAVFEHIDLSTPKATKIRERAGWMAYMFEDIRSHENDVQTFSLIRPERESAGEAISYAKSVLGHESTVINWADERERSKFLDMRVAVART